MPSSEPRSVRLKVILVPLLRILPPLSPCPSCGSGLIHGAWRFVVWSEDMVVGKVFCGGEAARLDQGSTPGGGGFYSSVVVGILREVEAPFALPPPVQFSGGRGLPSSVVAVLSPEGGGYHSSTLPAWNP
ncbi:hypothetical protein YC2023_080226 [Brassica napus]